MRPRGGRWIIDAHTHGTHLLPTPIRALHRAITRGQPELVEFHEVAATSVDAMVVAAVGDAIVTRWHSPSRWRAVRRQLAQIRADARAAGYPIATTGAELEAVLASRRPAVLLGLEGADPIGDDATRIDALHRSGVRIIGPMHYSDNAFGTICMSRDGTPAGRSVAHGRRRGLTSLGADLLAELNSRAILVDLAHADTHTVLDACERIRRPAICSHTGARALQDFPRYLPDHAIEAIAATGGLIGLWPYRGHQRGMTGLDDFARHAGHIAELVGAEHLCFGTDTNGVSGLLDGYRGPRDIPRLLDVLGNVGFSQTDVDGIAGANFKRLFSGC